MKYSILFVLLAFSSPPVNLGWKTLHWSDFRGRAPKGDLTTAAMIQTRITFGWDVDSWKGDSVTCFRAVVGFDPDSSWSVTSDTNVLRHEQGHLGLCYIECKNISYGGELFKKKGIMMSLEDWEKLRKGFDEEWDYMDSVYDAQTEHSQNKIAQEKWNKWIKEQLK